MRQHRRVRRVVAFVLALVVAGALWATSPYVSTPSASAANASDFNPGNIISDAIFYDSGSMSSDQVQQFLSSKVSACRAGYVCLKDYQQTTTSKSADSYCSGYRGATESAASIISKVAVSCGINPQVLIVLLEKEQSLVTDTWPISGQYQLAMGYGCPDSSGCDANYYGFFNQVYSAARQFQRYRSSPGSWGYQAGRYNTVLWSPDRSCGTSQLYIQNQATAGLYIYTPYRPNQAALNNLYGTGDNCSSYGNRNFWRLFTDWFGSTTAAPLSESPLAGGCDLTGDGVPDVLARKPDGTLWMSVAAGNGSLTSAEQIGQGWNTFDPILCAGDFTGDAHDDVIARRSDGTLWLYPGTGRNGGFGAAAQIGQGWSIFTKILIPGDMSGDGIPDLLGMKPDGTLWLYTGTGRGATSAQGVQVGQGWGVFASIVGPGDLNSDGRADLLGIASNGTMVFYPQLGAGVLGTGVPIGIGWNVFNAVAGAGDETGDRKPDLIARKPDGTLWLYAGSGDSGIATSVAFQTSPQIGTGWGMFDTITGPADLTGDGKADIIGRKPDGTLWLYPGTGTGTLSPTGTQIGTGWGMFDTITGPADLTGDGKADIIGRKPDGTLWLYPGTGTGTLSPTGTQIGTGWGMFDTITGPADLTGDGKADIIGRKPDGTLWLYPGTGTGTLSPTGTQIGTGWGMFDTITGPADLTGDGKADIIGRKPDGTLWLYPGTGTGTLSPTGTQIGTGWGMFDTITGPGDLTGDGKADIIGRKPDGTLWLYPTTPSAFTAGLQAGRQIGQGWNVFG